MCSSSTSCFPTSTVCRSCSESANLGPTRPPSSYCPGLGDGPGDRLDRGRRRLHDQAVQLGGVGRPLARPASTIQSPGSAGRGELTIGDLTLDGASHEVTRAGTPISLSSTEFELLRFLMRNPRRALTRTEILDRVWNYDFAGRTSIVDLYISYLRKKIDAGREPMIHTVRGVGYMLRAPA